MMVFSCFFLFITKSHRPLLAWSAYNSVSTHFIFDGHCARDAELAQESLVFGC